MIFQKWIQGTDASITTFHQRDYMKKPATSGKEKNMSTVIRPRISEAKRYFVNKHRYYELKHYCLQYKDWVMALKGINDIQNKPIEYYMKHGISDPTYNCVVAKDKYQSKIDMINSVAKEIDEQLSPWIVRAVTEGRTYEYFKTHDDIPCSRSTFYDRYRKFFWLLDKKRG